MAHVIYKFPVPVQDEFDLELPVGALFLDVQVQRSPQMWFLLDSQAPNVTRRFAVYGTGHKVREAETLKHLGTFQLQMGALVFHLFERRV